MPSAIISTEISEEVAMGRGGGGGGGVEGGDGGELGATGGQLRTRVTSVQVTVALIISVLALEAWSLRPAGVIPPLVNSTSTLHLGLPLQPI